MTFYASRSGDSEGHDVRQQPDGSYSCTCPAYNYGYECWAVKMEKAKRLRESLRQQDNQLKGITIPKREIPDWNLEPDSATLEQVKVYQEGGAEFLRESRRNLIIAPEARAREAAKREAEERNRE